MKLAPRALLCEWRFAYFAALCAAMMVAACGSPEDLHCRDLAAPEQATFQHVRALVVGPGGRSCSRCHTTSNPVGNLNFEGPGIAFDGLTSRRAAVYEQVASGEMPKGGPRWTEDQLRILRTWYCQGAPYAP